MFKIFIFVMLMMISACSFSSSIKDQDYEKEYWNTFYSKNNQVILLSNEIRDFNKNLLKSNKTLIDFYDLPKYIVKNKDKKFAIVIHKSNLRQYPSNKPRFEDANDTHFDLNQFKELKVGEPVIVLRKVNKWYKVSTYNVQGWVEAKNIANFDDYKSFKKYLSIKKFVVITEPHITLKNDILDMGGKFELVNEGKKFVEIKFPKRTKDGNVEFKNVKLPKKQVHIGYLAYTKRNLIRQATKYLGMPYGWGGLYNGIDCSGFVLNVYSVFGFNFPRNSFQQQNLNNKAIIISSRAKLNKVLNNTKTGSLAFFPGHIMMYLGKRNNKNYIIHSIVSILNKNKEKEKVMKVVITDLDIIRKTGNLFKDEIANVTEIK